MNILLDTNVLNAYLNPNDSLYSYAVKELSKVKTEDNILIPIVVVLELLAGNKTPNTLLDFLHSITQKFVQTTFEDLKYISTLDLKTRQALKGNDCAILAICKRLNAKLITFDKSLASEYNSYLSL